MAIHLAVDGGLPQSLGLLRNDKQGVEQSLNDPGLWDYSLASIMAERNSGCSCERERVVSRPLAHARSYKNEAVSQQLKVEPLDPKRLTVDRAHGSALPPTPSLRRANRFLPRRSPQGEDGRSTRSTFQWFRSESQNGWQLNRSA